MDEPIRPLPDRALIGMVHLPPLPGSPGGMQPLARIIDRACADAAVLADAGFDAVMVENFGDAPFRRAVVDPHTVACMTVVVRHIRQAVSLPIGVNVLRNDALAAVAIATACGAAFVRVNVHTGVYATDQGVIEGRADVTIRERRRLTGAGRIAPPPAVLADVHVKHASPLLRQSIGEAAEEAAYRGRADGLIVSGATTGRPTDPDDLRAVRAAVPDRPVYVGSGATAGNAKQLLELAHGLIVGTSLKVDGVTTAPVDPVRARAFAEAARGPL